MIDTLATRTPYQGLVQIFAFNRPFYLRSLAGVVAALAVAIWLPFALRPWVLLIAGIGAFWLCASLLVSHYIYDRSNLYTLSWLPTCLSHSPARWLNIHAGLDETSRTLASVFPDAQGRIIDIFDPREMTEPSISRARVLAGTASPSADFRSLPALPQQLDAAFLFFAAHELRQHEARVQLFREISRVLRAGGELVLVEHACDLANFLAFGPGCLHFFSQRAWHQAAHDANFPVRLHRTLTPFVHILVFRREQ